MSELSLLRVHNLAVSLDGFATGDGRAVDAPFGHAGDQFEIETTASPTGVVHHVFIRHPR